MEITSCRSCGAKIAFVLLAEHRRGPRGVVITKFGKHPIDAEPASVGTIGLIVEGDPDFLLVPAESRSPYMWVVDPLAREGRDLYVSHFASCPQASEWRKAKWSIK